MAGIDERILLSGLPERQKMTSKVLELAKDQPKIEELWVGLMSDAGEFSWPGYTRRRPIRRWTEIQCTWFVGIDLSPETIVWTAMYDARTGGNMIEMGIITTKHDLIKAGDSIMLHWYRPRK